MGTLKLSALMAFCLLILLLSAWVITKKGKLSIPHYVIVALCIYLPFLILGLLNGYPNPTIDIKFQFYGVMFYLFLVNAKKIELLRILFIINAVVCLVYILIYLGFIPSLWHDNSTGKGGRVYGPAIIPIVLICFYYLYNRMTFNMPLVISWLLAFVYLLLTSNLMNLVIAGTLLLLIVVNIRKLFKPGFIVGFSLLIAAFVVFVNSDYVPDAIKEKLPYVLKPWEYASLKTRIQDYHTALRAEDFTLTQKIFGKGFGVSTTVYRENKIAQSFSKNYSFREIDNGFYYIYHRGGFVLLLLFLLINIYLASKIPSAKAKFGFIIIVLFTNLLSIHYFTYVFYLLIPFLILETESKKTRHLSKKYSG